MKHHYCLTISCPDQNGIVAAVTQLIANLNGSLVDASYYSDEGNCLFFMRSEFKTSATFQNFSKALESIARTYRMQWRLLDAKKPKRMVILVSRMSHCVADLLQRWKSQDLDCDIVAVISNHLDLKPLIEFYDIPFHHIPVDPDNKLSAYAQIGKTIDDASADLVVLARYMQIIPGELCKKYVGRMINIHHSFLPSFIGANPYQKAHDRGVKLIGATCHYVTEALDEGPIIEQDVIRVSHRDTKENMVRLGKDVERIVLARGIQLHLDNRLIINGNKTIIFE